MASLTVGFLTPRMRGGLNDVLGGGTASVLSVTYGLSYALLIFGGDYDGRFHACIVRAVGVFEKVFER